MHPSRSVDVMLKDVDSRMTVWVFFFFVCVFVCLFVSEDVHMSVLWDFYHVKQGTEL